MNEPHPLPDPELESLLGAFALDAVDPDEHARMERYVATDADAQRELSRFEDVLAALASADAAEPPPQLWSRLEAQLRPVGELRPRVAPPAAPGRAGPGPATTTTDTTTTDTTTTGAPSPEAPPIAPPADELGRRRRRREVRLRDALVAAAAAVVVVALAGFAVGRSGGDGRPPSVQELAAAAQADPAHRRAVLEGTAGTAELVVDGEGRGYLRAEGLAPLDGGQTYQLWSLDGEAPVSLAVLGARPGTVAVPYGTVRTVAVSVEPAGGSASPTLPPVAIGEVQR